MSYLDFVKASKPISYTEKPRSPFADLFSANTEMDADVVPDPVGALVKKRQALTPSELKMERLTKIVLEPRDRKAPSNDMLDLILAKDFQAEEPIAMLSKSAVEDEAWDAPVDSPDTLKKTARKVARVEEEKGTAGSVFAEFDEDDHIIRTYYVKK